MKELKNYYPFVFISLYQPRHPEFPMKWPVKDPGHKNHRAVFVASRKPLSLPTLSSNLVLEQRPLGEIFWRETEEGEGGTFGNKHLRVGTTGGFPLHSTVPGRIHSRFSSRKLTRDWWPPLRRISMARSWTVP